MSTDLIIKDLRVSVEDKEILKGLSLTIKGGTIHAIMGPNGSGKSTLAYTLMGHPGYTVTSGEVWYKNQNILELGADERAKLGLFLAFQYPVAMPGVTVADFLRPAINPHRAEGGKDPNRQQLYKGFEAKRKRDEDAGVQRPPIPEAEHPVVLRHPDTGREVVYVSKGLTREIIGLERSESNALLKQLHQHATRPDAVYAHEWEVGDLVVFDALAGLHRRDSWDPHQQRVMRQLSTMVG